MKYVNMKYIKLFLFIFLFSFPLFAQESSQPFLSLKDTKVAEFRKTYPKYDGRGTIIIILDTGVDMGVPGLRKTTTGKVKVIDVQDFTGEGDLPFYKAEIQKDDSVSYFINNKMHFKVAGANKLPLKAIDDNYYIGRLKETLWRNSTSHVVDINGNGKTNDVFYFVTFKTKIDNKEFWVAYFDTNDNDNIADEKPLRNYKIDFDTFQIPNKKGLPKFTFAINIFPKAKKISLHFDDGAHGTHVAGIASGNKIDGGNFYGIAPGSQIISLKIGNNNFSGGATVTESMKKAYLYADKISKEKKEPCIINMSFGIGSEIEARSDMAEFLDNLVKNNHYLYISTANGNEGPAISTTGLPAASSSVFSSGAVLPKEIGSNLYGTSLSRNIILFFSSRGGEVEKPDVVSPGAATSTVPDWMNFDRFWGTSMASPYSAGVMSLLLSAAKQEFPKVKIPSLLLYSVIRESAVPMKGYTHLDQGSGYINVMNAYKLLKKYIKNGEISKFESYTISALSPNMPSNRAPALYIRDGSFITGIGRYSFRIRRNNFINKHRFFRTYKLKSDADWLIPIQKRTYIRNDQSTNISVRIVKSKIKKPGLYNGIIKAYRVGKTKIPEFDLMATVVIPYEFNAENNYRKRWHIENLGQGMIKRYFLRIPAGATSMKISMSAARNTYANSWYFLSAPGGRQINLQMLNSDKNSNKVEKYYYNLTPGVYELDALGFFRADKKSTFDLEVDFYGINRIGNRVVSKNNNMIHLVNEFNSVKSYKLEGKLLGYQTDSTINLVKKDVYNLPFMMLKNEKSKSFKISISKEDFNKITDFAIQIYNKKGIAIAKKSLSYDSETISISNYFDKDSVKLRLNLRPAFANTAGNMTIHIIETTKFKADYPIDINNDNSANITFFPAISKSVIIGVEKPNEYFPKNSKPYGIIKLKSLSNDDVQYELPLFFQF